MRRVFVSLVLLLFILTIVVATASAQTKPLTNDDVVKMVKAELGDDTVVKAIRASDTAFDTSPDALLQLKNAGLSKTVIDAMLEAQAKTKVEMSAKNERAPEVVPGLPKASGVYYQDPTGWVQLQDASMPKTKSKGLFGAATGVGKMRVYYVYRSAHAPAQFMTPQPVFYVRGLGKFGRDVQIIRLEVKKDSRTVQFASASALRGSSSSIDDKNIHAATVSRLGADVLTVTPAAPLATGEYLLSVDAEHDYDFGITTGR